MECRFHFYVKLFRVSQATAPSTQSSFLLGGTGTRSRAIVIVPARRNNSDLQEHCSRTYYGTGKLEYWLSNVGINSPVQSYQ